MRMGAAGAGEVGEVGIVFPRLSTTGDGTAKEDVFELARPAGGWLSSWVASAIAAARLGGQAGTAVKRPS